MANISKLYQNILRMKLKVFKERILGYLSHS